MSDFFFISHSSVDGKNFAIKLTDELVAGPPVIPAWLDERNLRPGEDWDEQLAEAIKTCKGMIFVMSEDSVRPDSVCKNEWVRALRYKKAVIPLLLERDAEPPFRLESREYIDFSGSFDPALARLRKHLVWMDSPAGQLRALKYRLSDAQRELPRARAEPQRQERIQEDIRELEREIAQQQRIIENPEEAERRVKRSIEAGLEGERKPAEPITGVMPGKFINPPPLIPPTWFQDRHFETRQIGEFIRDESLRLMTVVGRGGIGKSAMVCRLLRSLEGGQLPDDGGALAVDGIVYLSDGRSFHRVNVPDLYAGLVQLLPDETVRRLDVIYKNPQSDTRALVEALVQAFPRGRTVVLLDNFEDELAIDTGKIKDAELGQALRAFLELPPHGLKIIITTRVALGDLAMVEPGRQRRYDLDSGLEHPYAEQVLTAMDADGKVGLRDAPDSLLAEARERTLGYPRALEHLFGILSADRDTSLQEILDDTRQFLPVKVVAVLVAEAFSRLDATAQRVMQALAVYRYPVTPAAVDYLLQLHVPGVDSGRVLSRLVNMQFAHRDAGRYYLHQVDRDYALSRIAEGEPGDREAEQPPLTRFALRHRAAEWFKLSSKPRQAWKSLGDLAAQLSEFELRCEGEDYDTAAAVLLEFDFDYLFLWGHYRLMTELHERLQGKITDPGLASRSVDVLGSAYFRMAQFQRAVDCEEEAIRLARENKDRSGEGTWLGNLATSIANLGQNARAFEYSRKALEISREVGDRLGEAGNLSRIALLTGQTGGVAQAVEFHEQSLAIERETGNRPGEAEDLCNLAFCHAELGLSADSLKYYEDTLAIARDIGYRPIEAEVRVGQAALHCSRGSWEEAVRQLEQAIEIADDIGYGQLQKISRERLAMSKLHLEDLAGARKIAEAARQYDVPLENHATLAVLGVVAFRQGDSSVAAEAFGAALEQAEQLLAMTPDLYEALYTRALALCGMALGGDRERIPAAKEAYVAARGGFPSRDRGQGAAKPRCPGSGRRGWHPGRGQARGGRTAAGMSHAPQRAIGHAIGTGASAVRPTTAG